MSGLRRRWWLAHFSVGALASWTSGVTAAAEAPVVLVVGDSLSAEYGIAAGSGWVALLQARLAQQKKPHRVVNASISGDTTAGGRSRLPAALRTHKPAIVILELGGNDALRGLPLSGTRDNLLAMARAAQAAGAKVVIVGMQVPPNYGASYGREFEGLFGDVAKQVKAGLVPFLLKGVADRADALEWFQPDRIHPLAKAHPTMLDNVWPALRPLL
ncbi:arylesterase [Pelomonas sp. UHG3]|uniref:Arylesterase n=1 Tax=Roseateles hydrophilus TaxID=2975054 RepID=A0ACC6CDX7_9BURK|nr:arylesterase [Pelomonas sp. UHG3]MCY4746608.1 arylesterase [Pelomonas sp. UHG3]